MPVYLDDNEGRKDFIREKIKENTMVALDSSHIATWIFPGSMGYESSTFDAYADLVGTVASEFPTVEYSDIVQEIQIVLSEEEKEYFDAWAEYGMKLAQEVSKTSLKDALTLTISDSTGSLKLDTDIGMSGYDPNLPDC